MKFSFNRFFIYFYIVKVILQLYKESWYFFVIFIRIEDKCWRCLGHFWLVCFHRRNYNIVPSVPLYRYIIRQSCFLLVMESIQIGETDTSLFNNLVNKVLIKGSVNFMKFRQLHCCDEYYLCILLVQYLLDRMMQCLKFYGVRNIIFTYPLVFYKTQFQFK